MINISDYKEELKKLKYRRKVIFSGSSPPEIFVGKYGYPKVYAGIIAPLEKGDTKIYSSPEDWFRKQMNIKEIVEYRKKLIYPKFKSDIKNVRRNDNLITALNQISLSSKPVSAEFTLKKPVRFSSIEESSVPLIGNSALLKHVRLEENPAIPKSVEYITEDDRLKASEAIKKLYNKIEISGIVKILSAGLLGLKTQRKLVPTRWAITTIDDTLSKEMLKSIRYFPEINSIEVFNSEYLGNHYEIILLPGKYEFEVIEISLNNKGIWKDYEGFNGRKAYASSVTGAYYANRLALCEYLMRIKRQCSCIYFREIKPKYNVPLGVGILRENSRNAFKKKGEKFPTIKEALKKIQERIKINIEEFTKNSYIINNYGKQKRIDEWLSQTR
ncbi:MAG: hypothetical protein QXI33_02830 [Candidatus Pacearchaeota archaeon]